MPRNARYDVLFEPVRIGPVTAPNRFYQVPHCTGMGMDQPASLMRLREIKAEGGWGVVNTEYCSEFIRARRTHLTGWPRSGMTATWPRCRNWPSEFHRHGAWREWSFGMAASNRPIAPAGRRPSPLRAGRATTSIRSRRGPWTKTIFGRSCVAGCCREAGDAGRIRHRLLLRRSRLSALPVHIAALELAQRRIRRVDRKPGAPLARDDRGDQGRHRPPMRVAVRLAMDELMGEAGATHEREGREVVSLLAELPDLWDVNLLRRKRFHERPFFRRGLSGAVCCHGQEADQQTRGRGRALHLA